MHTWWATFIRAEVHLNDIQGGLLFKNDGLSYGLLVGSVQFAVFLIVSHFCGVV
jgi:hypothetical protein